MRDIILGMKGMARNISSSLSPAMRKELIADGWDEEEEDYFDATTEALRNLGKVVERTFGKLSVKFIGRDEFSRTDENTGDVAGYVLSAVAKVPREFVISWSGVFDMNDVSKDLASNLGVSERMASVLIRSGELDKIIEDEFRFAESYFDVRKGKMWKLKEKVIENAWGKGEIETELVSSVYVDRYGNENEPSESPNTPFDPSYIDAGQDFSVKVSKGVIKAEMTTKFRFDRSSSKFFFPGDRDYHEWN